MSLSTADRSQLRDLLHAGPTGPFAEPTPAAPPMEAHAAGATITVLGAHPWAGASTVALAIADVAATNKRVVLRDEHVREQSGLLVVSQRDLGVRPDGTRAGERGRLEVHAAASHLGSDDAALTVRDARMVVQQLPGVEGAVVLVCRASVPGMRAAEVALHRLDSREVVLAVVGCRRLPAVVRGAAGPTATSLYAEGRVVCVDYDRRLAVEGLDERRLPTSVLAAGRRILRAVLPDLELTVTKRSAR